MHFQLQALLEGLTRLVSSLSTQGLEVQDVTAGKTYVVRLGRQPEAESNQITETAEPRRTTW